MSDYARSTVSTISGVNAETQKIQVAVNSKMDKSGGAFTGTVDMNEQRLINLPDAVDPSEPLPLGQGLAIQEAAEQAAEDALDAAQRAEAAAAVAVQYPEEGLLAAALALGTADVGGATSGNVGSQVNRYLRTPEDFGGLGDGSFVNDTAMNTAVSVVNELSLPDKFRYNTTSSFQNPLGIPLTGSGHVVRTVTGGLEAQNTYADRYQRITGQEYLAAWYKNVWFQHLTPNRQLRIVFSGDSTTAGGVGNGVNDGFNIWELVPRGIVTRGLQTPFGTIGINRGQSGANTQQWVDNFVAGDIAAAGDLYVVRWGINDPGWLKDGTAPPIDSGQSYPNRRDLNDFATSLRAGLTLMRASLPFESVSILLMMPNSTYDIPNGRDALWYEQLRDVYVQAARDFNCAFIDTYAIMQDSRKLFNILMDNPMPTSGRGIHPNDAMNSIISGYICDLIAPSGMRHMFASNNILSIGGSNTLPPVSLNPDSYTAALYHTRALTTEGWPIDGAATTLRTADEIALQFHYGFLNADRGKLKARFGRAATLGGQAIGFSGFWDVCMSPPSAEVGSVTPSAGFSQFGGRPLAISVFGNNALLEGALLKDSPSTLSMNQQLAVYSGAYGTISDAAHGTATVFSGSAFEQIPVYVANDGIVRAATASSISAERVYINIAYIKR